MVLFDYYANKIIDYTRKRGKGLYIMMFLPEYVTNRALYVSYNLPAYHNEIKTIKKGNSKKYYSKILIASKVNKNSMNNIIIYNYFNGYRGEYSNVRILR